MIDLKRLRLDPEGSRASLLRRRDPSLAEAVDALLLLDREWREMLARVEALKAERNAASEEVARRKRAKEPADDLMVKLKTSGDEVKILDGRLREIESALERLALTLPNFPADTTPDGDAGANRLVRTWGEPPTFDFQPKPHWDLAASLGMLDLPAGAKLTGSGFAVFRGAGARLIRALAGFMLDLHTREHGYVEIAPPYLVNRTTLTGTGQLPKFEDDLYGVAADDLFLIPTAEVPVTNLHRDEIIEPAALPIRYAAYSPCFRREAGAAGRDTRGILRVHQFDKVEMVSFVRPEDSEAELEWLTERAEILLQRLGLAYRVVLMSTREMGFVQARKYDLEVWAPGVQRWLEVSSVSNFRDYQARRMAIRHRADPGGKPELVHTLNGSALALPRTMAAIIETHQQSDGSILVPEPLRAYLGGRDRLGSAGA